MVFHINPETGNVNKCSAKITCPFGEAEDHYVTADEARKAYEIQNTFTHDGDYPSFPIWNKNIPKALNDAIEYERLRQHTDEARREYLLAGYNYARELSDENKTLDEKTFLTIAKMVEPDSKGKYRRTPVTFANGGFAVPGEQVENSMRQLLRFWPDKDASLEDKKYWLKEMLVIHCLEDGNGRTAWVLQQWLTRSWDRPEKLWHFDF